MRKALTYQKILQNSENSVQDTNVTNNPTQLKKNSAQGTHVQKILQNSKKTVREALTNK